MRFALPLAAALTLALASPALAQDEPIEQVVDAPYRLHDTVWVGGQSKPLKGIITKGKEPGPHKLVIRLLNDIVTEVDRQAVTRILERETPESAYRSRSERVASEQDPALHGRLAEWALRQGLRQEAEHQLELAAKAGAGASGLPYRERAVELYERRLDELDLQAPDRGGIQEQILDHAAAGVDSPRLLIGRARVQRELGLHESALPLLAKARGLLEARAQQGGPDSGGSDEGGSDEGGSDESGPDSGGSDEGGSEEGGSDDEGAEGSEGGDEPPRRPPPRRFGRGGEDLEPEERPQAPQGGGGPQAAAATDNSEELLPGLSGPERELYRRCLGDQAAVALAAGVDQVARGAFERRLAVWPEDGPASAGLARLLSRVGERQAAIEQLGRALTVTPRERELLLLRGRLRYLQRSFGEAQADLERALQVAANDPLEARPVQVALGLVHLAAGRLNAARPLLEAADGEPGFGPARLARALLSELEGDLPTAEVHASEAIRLLASGRAEAHYQRAHVLRKAGKLSEARDALVESLREGYGFELANRARIDVADAERDAAAEARLTELMVRSAPAPTPDQLAALGRVYLRQERALEAQELFSRGLKAAPTHPGCLRGLAYCAYARDERLKAYALFKQLLEQDKTDAWAARGLKQLEQARSRRVWSDDFQRADGEVLNAWTVEAPFGVTPRLAGGRLVFAGPQKNQANGKTVVSRAVASEVVVRFEARLEVAPNNQGRVGLRFASKSFEAVLFVNPQDGQLYSSTRRGERQPWSDPVALGPFGDAGPHTIAIDIEDPKRGVMAFLRDGERLGEAQCGNASRAATVTLSLYGQGAQLGELVELGVEQVWVYVLRPPQKRKSGGY